MRSLQEMVRKYLFKDRYMRFSENTAFFNTDDHLGKLDLYTSIGVQLSKLFRSTWETKIWSFLRYLYSFLRQSESRALKHDQLRQLVNAERSQKFH